jgi:hypothetical protein
MRNEIIELLLDKDEINKAGLKTFVHFQNQKRFK